MAITTTKKQQDPDIFRSSSDMFSCSPEWIGYIIDQANRGNTYNLYKYARMIEEKDFEIAGLLNLRKSAVKSSRAFAVPPSNDMSPEAKNIALFCQNTLDNAMPSALSGLSDFEGWQDNAMHALNSGISCSQIHWGAGGRYIKGFEYFDQTNFSFSDSYKPRLKYRNSDRFLALDPLKWVVHYHNPRGGDPTRGGLIRPLAYLYFFKKHVYQFNIRAIEKFLIPFVTLLASPEDMKDPDKLTALQTQIQNIGADGGGILSQGSELEFNESKGNQADIYEKFHSMCRRQASQLIIGSDSGVFAEGSNRSTASVQDSVRKNMTLNDTADLRRTIRSQIYKPLVEMNFGVGAPIPDVEFKFDMDTGAIATVMKDMWTAGFTMPVEELNKITGLKWEKVEGQAPEVVEE
jgi:phage gp29-like protein